MMTPQEFWDKVEWEGGLLDALFEYGLDENDLDDSDPALKVAVRQFREAAGTPLRRLEEALEPYYR